MFSKILNKDDVYEIDTTFQDWSWLTSLVVHVSIIQWRMTR